MENTKSHSSVFDVKRPLQLCCPQDLPNLRLFPCPVCSSLWQILMALTSETSWCLYWNTCFIFTVSCNGLSGTLAFLRTFVQGHPCHRLPDLNSPQRLWRESPWPIYSPHLTLLWIQHHVGGNATFSYQSGMNPWTLEPRMEQFLLVFLPRPLTSTSLPFVLMQTRPRLVFLSLPSQAWVAVLSFLVLLFSSNYFAKYYLFKLLSYFLIFIADIPNSDYSSPCNSINIRLSYSLQQMPLPLNSAPGKFVRQRQNTVRMLPKSHNSIIVT